MFLRGTKQKCNRGVWGSLQSEDFLWELLNKLKIEPPTIDAPNPATSRKPNIDLKIRCINIRGLGVRNDIVFNQKFKAVTSAYADVYVFLEHRTPQNSFSFMLRKYRLTLLARFKTYHSISHGRGIWILIQKKCPLAISTCEEITPDIFKIILNDDI